MNGKSISRRSFFLGASSVIAISGFLHKDANAIQQQLLFMGGERPAVEVSNTANNNSTSALTTYTFAAQSLGAEDSSRRIVVVTAATRLGSPAAVSSMTIGGVSASLAVARGNGNANEGAVEIWHASVPTGTTGDVVVTWTTGMLRCAISVFRLINSAVSPSATNSNANSSSAVSATIDIPQKGVAIAGVYNNGSTTYTWTNLTEAYDVTFGATAFSSAADAFATAQTALSITATQASNNPPQALVVASWGRP